MVEAVRLRTVDDVVLVFLEPNADLGVDLGRWYAAMSEPGVNKTLVLTVGPLISQPQRRRHTVSVIKERGIRLAVVSSDRHNRGLIGMFSYFGVPIASFDWATLEQAARSVAARPELVDLIVRVARQLRAESPAAAGLDYDEG